MRAGGSDVHEGATALQRAGEGHGLGERMAHERDADVMTATLQQ
jgi:hypothetical protein